MASSDEHFEFQAAEDILLHVRGWYAFVGLIAAHTMAIIMVRLRYNFRNGMEDLRQLIVRRLLLDAELLY